MTTLTITRGISGSGKSTWARQQNAFVVSRDSIRVMLFGSDGPEYYKAPKETLFAREDAVTIVQDQMVAGFLKAGKDVIVDDTNIAMKYVNRLAKIGYRYGADVEVKIFDVDLETAYRRDDARWHAGGRHVGLDIIKKQHERFKASKKHTLAPVQKVLPYQGTPGKPAVLLIDIDGTLGHMDDRRGPFEWHKVGLDRFDTTVANVAIGCAIGLGLKIVVMSGRDEVCRPETMAWMDENHFPYDYLFMRPKDDMRPDNLIKAELFDHYVRDNFDVQFVLDDRDQVVEMWRRMEITTLQVAPGDF